MTKQMPEETLIRCPWCLEDIQAKEWDELSKSFCMNREMRKAYIPIFNTKVFNRDSEYFYKCPKCGTWTRGNQLIIENTDIQELKKIGRMAIVAEVCDNDECNGDTE